MSYGQGRRASDDSWTSPSRDPRRYPTFNQRYDEDDERGRSVSTRNLPNLNTTGAPTTTQPTRPRSGTAASLATPLRPGPSTPIIRGFNIPGRAPSPARPPSPPRGYQYGRGRGIVGSKPREDLDDAATSAWLQSQPMPSHRRTPSYHGPPPPPAGRGPPIFASSFQTREPSPFRAPVPPPIASGLTMTAPRSISPSPLEGRRSSSRSRVTFDFPPARTVTPPPRGSSPFGRSVSHDRRFSAGLTNALNNIPGASPIASTSTGIGGVGGVGVGGRIPYSTGSGNPYSRYSIPTPSAATTSYENALAGGGSLGAIPIGFGGARSDTRSDMEQMDDAWKNYLARRDADNAAKASGSGGKASGRPR